MDTDTWCLSVISYVWYVHVSVIMHDWLNTTTVSTWLMFQEDIYIYD